MAYTKLNPSPSNQYTDTTLYQVFDQALYESHLGVVYITNTTGGAGDGAKIQQAISDNGANKRYVLSPSAILLDSEVNIPYAGVELVGMPGSILNVTSAGRIVPAEHNITLRNLRFNSAITTHTPGGGYIFSQGCENLKILNAEFWGGPSHISLNTCPNFTIRDAIHHTTPTVTSTGISAYIYNCPGGLIDNCSVHPGVMQGAGDIGRAYFLNTCTEVVVRSLWMNGVDFSQNTSGAGLTFYASSNCTANDCIISDLKGADAFATEAAATDITFNNCHAFNNDEVAGVGSVVENGDGFDIFNSQRIYINNCSARFNGAHGVHPNLEIYTCTDVHVANCDMSDCLGATYGGIIIIGSPNVSLTNVISNRNRGPGVTLWEDQFANQCYNVKIIGGDYSDNNQNNNTGGQQSVGIYMGNDSEAIITGVRAVDTRSGAARTQLYGLRLENTADCIASLCDFRNNKTAQTLDSVGASQILNNFT